VEQSDRRLFQSYILENCTQAARNHKNLKNKQLPELIIKTGSSKMRWRIISCLLRRDHFRLRVRSVRSVSFNAPHMRVLAALGEQKASQSDILLPHKPLSPKSH